MPDPDEGWKQFDADAVAEDIDRIEEEARAAGEEAARIEAPEMEFDPQYREAFQGLLFIGRLEREFDYLGHTFVVKTLTTGEKLEMSQIVRPYEGSFGHPAAYRAAVAAGAILLVDGKPIPVAVKGVSPVRQRFDWLTANWYDPVIDKIYDEAMFLERQVLAILAALGALGAPDERAVETEELNLGAS